VGLPHDEFRTVMKAMEEAQRTGDIEVLKWSARMILMLYELSEIIEFEYSDTSARIFNTVWKTLQKIDKAPLPKHNRPNTSGSTPCP
jgi:hypothetical protein